jgi:hypothetical protein
MRLTTHSAKGHDPLRKVTVTVPAPASGNTNTATVNHGLTDLVGNPVTPAVVIPVARGNTARQVTVHVSSVNDTQVQLRVVTSETTMTAVDLDLYVG